MTGLGRVLTALAVALGAAPAITYAQPSCDPPRNGDVLSQYLESYSECIDAALNDEEMEQDMQDTLSAMPSSPPAAGGFGTSLRDSIEDFLPLFSFAVDSVSTSDDDRSLTVRFNPIRAGAMGSLAVSVTATQPETGELVLQQVSEQQQSALETLVEKELDDLSNLTWSAKWGYERKGDMQARRLFGRSYENYRAMVEKRLLPAVGRETQMTEADSQALDACAVASGVVDPMGATIGALRANLGARFDACLELWKKDERRVVEADKKLDALALVPFLIDNQPQLVVTLEIDERDVLVGRSGWSAKVAYEKGFENFNTLLRRYHRNRKDLAQADDDALKLAFWEAIDGLDDKAVEAENKLTFSAVYRERDADSLDRVFGEGDDAIPVTLDLPRRDETCVKLEWHRNATWHPITIGGEKVYPRMHLSAEYVDVSDDPERQDRLVGVFTYEIPLPSGMTLPISLSYASHSEFLEEPDKRLSAHFGLSYKLPIKGN